MDVDAEGEEEDNQSSAQSPPQHQHQQQPPLPQDTNGAVPGAGAEMDIRRRQEMFARNWEALSEARGQAEDYVKELQRQESTL